MKTEEAIYGVYYLLAIALELLPIYIILIAETVPHLGAGIGIHLLLGKTGIPYELKKPWKHRNRRKGGKT